MELRTRVGSTFNGIPADRDQKLTGPITLFAPGTPIRYVGVLTVEQGHGGGQDDYIALSFGPSDPAIPVQSGDVYASATIAKYGVYAWYKGHQLQKWFLDVMGTDHPIRPGRQSLTQDRIPTFSLAPGYPFEWGGLMAATVFIRREAIAVLTTDGPIEMFPRGTLLGTLAILFSAYVPQGGNPSYTAISFGKDGVKLPVEAGDIFCADELGKDGIYLWRVNVAAGSFRLYAVGLTPDMSVILGSQSLTSPRVTDP